MNSHPRKNYLARSRKPIKRVNRKRKKSEFARTYHSRERVEFVKSLPCCACGVVGYSENAHIETGGMGRKADYTKIIPLCRSRFLPITEGAIYTKEGCHSCMHTMGRDILEKRLYSPLDLDAEAARVESLWLSRLATQDQEGGRK